MRFLDAFGRLWKVYDYCVVGGERRRVPVGDRRAQFRTFVPEDLGRILVYEFGYLMRHGSDRKTFASQLAEAERSLTEHRATA